MERHFEIELSELKERLLWMGSLAERAVHQAIHSVLDAQETSGPDRAPRGAGDQ